MRILSKRDCKFAVKSGGHNANPGANSIDGGISIDLKHLNATKLAADRSYVTLETGITWGNAYHAFEAEKIAFPGGICEDVGVGGLAVGGGQSLFQASKGWVVDNILRYEIVLADGTAINATQSSHADLFKALKGGNTNFGIVTNVDIAAFDFDVMWGGEVFLNLTGPETSRSDMLDRLSHATVDFIANNEKDLDTGLQVVTSYLRNGAQVTDLALTNVANVAKPSSLDQFLSIPNKFLDTTRHTSLATIAHQTSLAVPKGFRYVTASVTIKNDYNTLRQIWDLSDATYQGLTDKNKVDWMVSFVPQPRIQESYSASRGGNSLGLDQDSDEIVIWLLSRWDDVSLDSEVDQARNRFINEAEAIATRNNAYASFVYINYAGPSQDPLCGYGADTVAFLRGVATKYDPTGVFQRLMPGGFKLSSAQC